ncbi:TetR/AcrR family transcriptional regulator [Solimonas sp. K1W22B-7]|uniref:TetR/AcrR family transcriptional regulator n=1 Tax=Solimonas sp. K1W22B-7 TaxID=2303331 RepID=UPI000E335F47|nr:TetR/AcrR family transcriptional regulator [Solimonas sp. K1W22B-7]AXQ30061.1 TetR/AcrR family transcriptional regulator [Solimonas sp. K1W22B-7]
MQKTKSPRPLRPTKVTRSAILEAAEKLFARRGYAVARLEDVGDAVGLTRPALFYHFPDKQSLYNAVLEEAFRPLVTQIDAALSSSKPIPQRIEDAAEAWVDGVAARPTLSRLILRHVADAEEHPMQSIYPDSDRFIGMAWGLFQKGIASGELKPLHDDPFHAASAIIGTTVFYVNALSVLIPNGTYNPLEPHEIAAHKAETINSVRRLLGIATAPPKAKAGAAGKRPAKK